MYDLTDTIVAVSSAGGGVRSIVRITGPQTLPACERVFESQTADFKSQISNLKSQSKHRALLPGCVRLDEELRIEARLYLFLAPHSYTGEPLAEIHLNASNAVVAALMQSLLAGGLRPAGPGEFTARAYLNGKIDLAQAEAVNEIVSSSNRFQLDAAEKLLSGRLSTAVNEIRTALLDCMSLIEAGLDFSEEDIEFIRPAQAVARLARIRRQLDELLAGSIRYESLIDLPAIAIAGAPNAGKSSLLNVLLGRQRSIVSPRRKTTRDVLSGLCAFEQVQCVLFDCAGLLAAPESVLDELAQQAALEALHGSAAVLFCVDAAKGDWDEDRAVRALAGAKPAIHVATKCDLLGPGDLAEKLAALGRTFDAEFLPTSAQTGAGLDRLRDRIRPVLIDCRSGQLPAADAVSGGHVMALTVRHRQAVTDAIENVTHAAGEIEQGNDEVAVMLLRTACRAVADIEQEHIDEQILDRIFSRFCVGK